jgi:hypothetical protein
MATEEEIKKAQEEADKKYEARLNERVAREAEAIRRDTEARYKNEMEGLRAENRALQEAQKKVNEDRKAACLAEIETLKAEVDPAVLELFEALPDEITPEGKRDWLKKVSGKMPAPPPSKMPNTPSGKKKVEKQIKPYDEIKSFV